MRKGKRRNHKGYSMVELIIVIGIIGILSAVSLVTWRSVDSANYKKAVSTFESELSTLRTATMSQDSRMAMRLYYDSDDDCYYVERGYWNDGFKTDASGDPTLDSSSYYDYAGTSNPVKILRRGRVAYEGSTLNSIVIRFQKSDGSVLVGDGKFSFYRGNGELISNVNLTKNTGIFYETYQD